MMKPVAVVASLAVLPLLASTARAEGETTTSAGTVVVVTPSAPVVVSSAPSQVPAVQPPGAAEEPPIPAPPAGPPQNEPWSNVSHINGHLVPVGERGSYLYSFKKTNLSSDPLAWMFGYFQLSLSHAISSNLAVSVEASAWSHDSSSGYELSASLPIYFRRTFSGPFLEPGLVVHTDNDSYYAYDCIDCSGTMSSNTWTGPEVLFGWHWMFDSGLNVSAAFGAAKPMNRQSDPYGYTSDDPEPAGYFRVGYAF